MDLTSIPEWMINLIPYKMWDEITNPFPNVNNTTLDV